MRVDQVFKTVDYGLLRAVARNLHSSQSCAGQPQACDVRVEASALEAFTLLLALVHELTQRFGRKLLCGPPDLRICRTPSEPLAL